MTLNLINIYSQTHQQHENTCHLYELFNSSETKYIKNKLKFNKSAFYVVFYGIIYIVEGHTA